MKPATTRLLLVLGLIGTLGLVWLAPSDDEAAAPAVDKSSRGHRATAPRSKPAASTAARTVTATPGQLNNQERPALPEKIPDVFAAFSWYVPPPPPPPPPPAPPPPPTAPPLPFAYFGQYLDGDTKLIILTRGDRLLTVSAGDTIDRTYQVGSLKGGQLTFLYLPLNIEQSLNTGIIQ